MGQIELLKLVKTRREEILGLARQYGASNVRLFGSVARGDATEGSDIDLLVDMEPGRSLFDLGGLLTDLNEKLGCHVDVATEKLLKPSIHDRVMREAIPL